MNNLRMNPILEGLHESRDPRKQILKTEGTTSADISTPAGKLNPTKESKTYTCPECGSTDVLITGDSMFHCTKCEHEWTADEEAKRRESDTPKKETKEVDEKSKRKSIKTKSK